MKQSLILIPSSFILNFANAAQTRRRIQGTEERSEHVTGSEISGGIKMTSFDRVVSGLRILRRLGEIMDFRDDLPTACYILDINTLMNVLTKYFQKQLGLSRDAVINE